MMNITTSTQARVQLNAKGLDKEGLFAQNVRSVQRLDDEPDTVSPSKQQSSAFIAIRGPGQLEIPNSQFQITQNTNI